MTQWQERFTLDLPDIDQDHRILFDLINQLHTAYAAGRPPEDLDVVFRVLNEYVANHFAREERLMREGGYPKLLPHVAAHARFGREVETLYRRYREGGDELLVIALLGLLSNWWHFHVLEDDAEYGRHLRAKSGA